MGLYLKKKKEDILQIQLKVYPETKGEKYF